MQCIGDNSMGTNCNGIRHIGEKYKTLEGYTATIINYFDRYHVEVKLNDGTVLIRRMDMIKKGKVANPNHRTVCGIGFTGEGDYVRSINGVHTQASRMWKGMLFRCYSSKSLRKHKTYSDCTVCEEWHNYQNFAKWHEENYYQIENQEMHLDKDILVKRNKVYSPDTCVFVPEYINSLFTKRQSLRGCLPIGVHYTKRGNKYIAQCNSSGNRIYLGRYDTSEGAFEAYKAFKEEEIKKVANKYKEYIPTKLYDVLYKYEVEITD